MRILTFRVDLTEGRILLKLAHENKLIALLVPFSTNVGEIEALTESEKFQISNNKYICAHEKSGL